MKQVSEAYKESMKQDVRNRSTMIVAIGDINPILQTEATGREGYENQVAFFCRPYYLTNGVVFRNGTDYTYSSLEHNFTRADGSMFFVPYNTPEADVIDTGLTTYSHVRYGSSQAIDIMFPSEGVKAPFEITVEMREYIPTRVTFELHGDEGQIKYHTFINETNRRLSYTFDTLPESTSGEYHLAILFSLNEETDLSQRARIKSIIFGSGVCVFPDIIESAETKSYSSMTNENLPTDDLTVNLINYNARYDADNPNNPLAILDNKNQEINVYYGYDVADDGTYEWVKGCNVVASDWNSKQHTATITGVDRFRNNETLFIHSYNTITYRSNAEWVIMYCLYKMFGYINFVGKGTDRAMKNQIIATTTCKETLHQLSSFCGTQMLFDENGNIVFTDNIDESFDIVDHTEGSIIRTQPSVGHYEIPKNDTTKAYVRFRVIGHNYEYDCEQDITFYREMEYLDSRDVFFYDFESYEEPATLNVTGAIIIDVLRVIDTPESEYFDMTKDDVLEDMVASKEDRVQEIIVPYFSPNKVTQDTQEVASIMCDISASQSEFKFDVDLGGVIYADKYVYQADGELVIPLSNFYEDSTINRSTGARDTDTKSTCSGFRAVTSGEYFRITCDEDKIITGYGEYSTNATSGFIRWVDINDDKCVKKMGSNCNYIRVEVRYPDDSAIDVSELKQVRLAQAKRSSFKTPNDYAIVTVNKAADFPTSDTLEIFVTAKSYYNFTSSDVSVAVNSDGKVVRWENPLIASKKEATFVANSLKAKMNDNIIYEYDYRGNPEIEVGDIIRQENDFNPNLKVVIQEHKIGFNGALSGEIVAKRRLDV